MKKAPEKKWTLTEMVQQWQKCFAPDNRGGCLIRQCPLFRRVIVQTGGDVGMTNVEVDISFQGCSLVATLNELAKSGWSRKPFKEENGD